MADNAGIGLWCDRCGAGVPGGGDYQLGADVTIGEGRGARFVFCSTHADEALRLLTYYADRRLSLPGGDRIALPIGPSPLGEAGKGG